MTRMNSTTPWRTATAHRKCQPVTCLGLTPCSGLSPSAETADSNANVVTAAAAAAAAAAVVVVAAVAVAESTAPMSSSPEAIRVAADAAEDVVVAAASNDQPHPN